MPKLPRYIKAQQLLRALLKMGFVAYKGRGSHRRLKHADGRWTQIPLHAKPIPQGTLKQILKQTDISIEDLQKHY